MKFDYVNTLKFIIILIFYIGLIDAKSRTYLSSLEQPWITSIEHSYSLTWLEIVIGSLLMVFAVIMLIFNLNIVNLLTYPIGFFGSALTFWIVSFSFMDFTPNDADFHTRNLLIYVGIVVGVIASIFNYRFKTIGLFTIGMLSGIQLSINLTRLDFLMGNIAHSVVAITTGLTVALLLLLFPINLGLVLISYSGSDLLLVGIDLIIRKEYNQFNQYGWVRSYTSPSKSIYILTSLCFLMAILFSLIHFQLNKYFRLDGTVTLESYSPFPQSEKSIDLDEILSSRSSMVMDHKLSLLIEDGVKVDNNELPIHWSKGLTKHCDYEYYINKYHQEKYITY